MMRTGELTLTAPAICAVGAVDRAPARQDGATARTLAPARDQPVSVVVPDVVRLCAGVPQPAEQVGGRATLLDQLVQAGFPVPPTAVATAAVYRSVAAHPDLRELLARLRAGEVLPAEEADAAFLTVPVPAALAWHLTQAAREVGNGGRLAVRSSATVDDAAGAAFAGLYRSTVDVEPDEVLDAVRRTWASLWHPAPCAYRRARRLSDEDVAMPVVLMRMVPALSAGVVYTRDPGGAPGTLRVEAAPEPGGDLVPGDRHPELWLLPREGAVPSATPVVVAEAAALALRVEQLDGGVPQDVEWVWDGAATWLVQTRAGTSGPAVAGDGDDVPPHWVNAVPPGLAPARPRRRPATPGWSGEAGLPRGAAGGRVRSWAPTSRTTSRPVSQP
jgi:pyruvate,water dikinase